MSAVCFQLITFLCLSFGAPGGADVEGVVRRNVGESVSIQCIGTPSQQYLSLKKGLNEEQDIFYTAINSSKPTIDSKFTNRLQSHEKYPKVEILIKNLTLNDTGLYWCVYKMMDKNYITKTTRGNGSVLLVVSERRPSPTVPKCDQSQSDLVLVYVVICAAVVMIVLTVLFIWIILKKKHTAARTSRDEDVSERANSREDTL